MIEIRYNELSKKIYSYLYDSFFVPACGVCAPTVPVTVSFNGSTSYSTYACEKYHIILARKFLYDNVYPSANVVSPKVYPRVFKDTVLYLLGFFYHELGHVLYTDFSSEAFVKRLPYEDQGKAQQLFNVLEDPYIEVCMKKKAPTCRKYFRFLILKIFKPLAASYNDDETAASFYNYLLLALRLTSKEVPAENKFFNEHREDISSFVKKFYTAETCEDRINTSIDFYLALKEWGLKFAETTPEVSFGPFGKSVDFGSAADKGDGSSCSKRSPYTGGCGSSSVLDDKGEFEEKASSGELDADEFDCPTELGFESYDSFASSTSSHIFAHLNEMTSLSADDELLVDEYIQSNIKKFSRIIDETVDVIDEYDTEHAAYYEPGYISGSRIDIKHFTNGHRIEKCFSRKVGMEYKPDPCFYIMVDGSGSMSGEKSYICTQSMVILYETLARLNLPFELVTFTNTGDYPGTTCLTYILKAFEDSPADCYKNLCFTDSRYFEKYKRDRSFSMFHGNYDEVNVAFCADRLKQQPNRSKFMIVLSDGQTCGSSDDLRHVVSDIEGSGIGLMGIGICSTSVKGIYTNHYIFSSTEELEKFPEFLSDFIINSYIK